MAATFIGSPTKNVFNSPHLQQSPSKPLPSALYKARASVADQSVKVMSTPVVFSSHSVELVRFDSGVICPTVSMCASIISSWNFFMSTGVVSQYWCLATHIHSYESTQHKNTLIYINI